MEVLDRFNRQEANIRKPMAPTPISCDNWDVVNFEPSEKEEKEQKGPASYTDEDSVIVVHKNRKEKGAYKPLIVSQLG